MDAFSRYFDLIIHCENEIHRKPNIDPDLYSYIVLLNEIAELCLRNVSSKQTVEVTLSYKVPTTENMMPLKNDMDVVNMFNMHRNGSEIHVFANVTGSTTGEVGVDIGLTTIVNESGKVGDYAEVEMFGHVGSSRGTMNVRIKRKLTLDQDIYSPPANESNVAWEAMHLESDAENERDTDSNDAEYEAHESGDDYESFSDDEENEGEYDITLQAADGNGGTIGLSADGGHDQLSDIDENREDGLGLNSDSEDDIYRVDNFRGQQFQGREGGHVFFERGMLFVDIHEFRSALRDYTIQEGFDILRLKNEKRRITCRCSVPGCTWRIHASPKPDGVTYQVKTYVSVHTCVRNTSNQNCSWIASKLKIELSSNPKMTLSAMRQILQEKYGLTYSNMKLYRARCKARDEMEGGHRESYNLIPDYAEVLLQSNPGSTVKIQYDRQAIGFGPSFKRIFICFDTLKTGFLKGCRPFIGLDGCHLKGPFGGILLAAVALDGNNGIYPLAFGVVETECKDSWHFFLYHLSCVIGQGNNEVPFTFMSDRQKGIGLALEAEFPRASHRVCCRHLLANIKANFTGTTLALKNHYWVAASASSKFVFDKAMAQVRKCSEPVYSWLCQLDVNDWPRHTMNQNIKVNHVTNNITESFNSWVGELREKPIMGLLEGLRCKIMAMLHNRYERANSWETYRVTPVVRKKLDMLVQDARFLRSLPAGHGEYNVTEGFSSFVVNLVKWSCNCGVWDISGIPCKHAAICIMHERRELADFVHHAFTKEAYLETYKNIIHPVPDPVMWESSAHEKINPPPLKRLPGRPRSNRRREPDEPLPFKRSGQGKCKTYGQIGHNKRTCQRAPVKTTRRKATDHATTSQGSIGVESSTPLNGWGTNGAGITMSQPVLETSIGVTVNQGRRILAQTTRGRGSAFRRHTMRLDPFPAARNATDAPQGAPTPFGVASAARNATDPPQQAPTPFGVAPAARTATDAPQQADPPTSIVAVAPHQGPPPSSAEFAMF